MYTTPKIINTKFKRNRLIRVIIIFIVVMFMVLNAGGLYISNLIYEKACRGQTSRGIPNLHEIYKNTFDDKRFAALSKEKVMLTSDYGYKLSGTYIKNPKTTNNTVIIVHGYGGSRWESMKYADMYIDLGFNTVIYDSRFSGESGGNDVSFGFYEKYDLDKWVNWVYNKNNKGLIGVHGESMGAATALLHSKLNQKDNKVKFYVADCPYSNLTGLLRFRLKEDYNVTNKIISSLLTFYINTVTYVRSGFTLSDVSPIKVINNISTPIMFIHGDSDKYIPYSMSKDMYNIKKGPKDLYIAPYSGHAQAYLYNKKEYTQKVRQFLIKNNFLTK